MRTRFGLGPPPIGEPAALTIGNFDGVHRGHQAVIARALAAARAVDGVAALLTFDPHPRRVHDPLGSLPQLTTLDERLREVARLGIDQALVVAYTRELSAWSADHFMREVEATVDLRHLVVGYDITVGPARSGDAAWLRERGRRRGYPVTVVQPIIVDTTGVPVHSSEIRRLLAEGAVGEAATLLGRSYTLTGRIEPGDRIGRTLGFPTANLALPSDKLIPALGIYAAWARDLTAEPGVRRQAAISIGYRPTFDKTELRVEAFLLDFDGDLYDHELELELVARLRGEVKFDGVESLKQAIAEDVADARRVLRAAE